MMTCKLIFNNLRKNIKDYAIYFCTLVIAISLFYAFNASMHSKSLASLGSELQTMAEALAMLIQGVSYLIAFIMAFLILYVNLFLLKRRKKELGIYMLLGMKKGKISRIFVGETFLVGVCSFVVGIIMGTFVEQVLTVFVLKMFGGYVNDFQVGFSTKALGITAICFGLIFILVMLFNVFSVYKVKLIELLTAERKNEELKAKALWVYGIVFFVGIICMTGAYVCLRTKELLPQKEMLYTGIVLILVATFAFFYSVSAVVLEVLKRNKKFYYKDINCFLVRQIGSKIQSNFTSMSFVAFLLAVTLILLTVGTSIAISAMQLSNQFAPYDFTIMMVSEDGEKMDVFEEACGEVPQLADIVDTKFQIEKYKADFTYGDLLNGQKVVLRNYDESIGLLEKNVDVLSLSDYNECLKMQGEEPITLEGSTFLLNCNYNGIDKYMKFFIENCDMIIVAGEELVPAKRELFTYTYQMTSLNNNDRGTIIVADEIAQRLADKDVTPIVQGFYKKDTNTEKANQYLATLVADLETSPFAWTSKAFMNTMYYSIIALPTFLFLYIGLIFMLICVALLSVQQLTAVSENANRYLLLKRQGVTDGMLRSTIRKQVGVYFMAPLLLAAIYAGIALPAVMIKVSNFTNMEIGANIFVTMVLMLLVYGGYYVMTSASCEKMTIGRSID